MNRAERKRTVAELNARVRALRLAGLDDMALFAAMADRMPTFKRFMDAGGFADGEINRLARRCPDLYYYACLLTAIADVISDGAIQAPR